MTWEDLIIWVGAPIGAESFQAPRKENAYNEPSVSFYKDGSVWVSGAKGSTRLYKNAPYGLMFYMWKQRAKEVENEQK